MPAYDGVDELLVQLRTGRGVAVLVEGESHEDDAWFYGQWFGDLARDLTFFPQNGWPQVVAAVGELRQHLPRQPVYGIIDRDFATDAELTSELPRQGIVRTRRYALENYLLEPACWAEVFQHTFRRQGTPPEGWQSEADLAARIEEAYRQCIPISAHNRVVHTSNRGQEKKQRENKRPYLSSWQAATNQDLAAQLRSWGHDLDADEDLGALFEEQIERLSKASIETWQQEINGKHVLKVLHNEFPRPPRSKGQLSLHDYLNRYMDPCFQPPADLVELMNSILDDAFPHRSSR